MIISLEDNADCNVITSGTPLELRLLEKCADVYKTCQLDYFARVESCRICYLSSVCQFDERPGRLSHSLGTASGSHFSGYSTTSSKVRACDAEGHPSSLCSQI